MAAAFYVKITCSPPLGQLSVLPPDTETVSFVICLEWSGYHDPKTPWEVAICFQNWNTTSTSLAWSDWPLMRTEGSGPIIFDQCSGNEKGVPSNHLATFAAEIPVSTIRCFLSSTLHFRFTVKYRQSSHAPWHWVKHDFGIDDGEIIVQKPLQDDSIHQYVKWRKDWQVNPLHGNGDASRSFLLKSGSPIPKRSGQDAKFEEIFLVSVQDQVRFFAIVRYQEMWLGPRHGRDKLFLSEDAITCSCLTASGHHVTLLAMNGVNDVQTLLRSDGEGNVIVAARNDGEIDSPFLVLAAVALTLEDSIKAVVSAAREIIANSGEVKESTDQISELLKETSLTPDKEAHPLDDWYDGLAYCTYNSLGIDLTTDRILSGLDSLEKHGINVATLIIDDNWQFINDEKDDGIWRLHQGWQRFEANEKYFPEGLRSAISKIRTNHPYLGDIAVWHALLGYWGGIHPHGQLARDYSTTAVDALLIGHVPGRIHAIDPKDIHRFYQDFYAFLRSCDVTAVKTDVQFMLDALTSTPDRAAFATSYQSAWTAAHLRHFGGKAISCMSMIPQILFHSFLPTTMPRLMLRNTDDFYPEVPSSHALHVFANAHNALFTGQLNVLPDWDMFQTKHSYSGFHAAARCLSGGPIYITDSPGEHDVELIRQMTGMSLQGRMVAIRPQTLGTAVGGYDAFAEGHVLKIATASGPEGQGTGMLGLFNTSEKEVKVLVPIEEIPGVNRIEGTVLVRSHRMGTILKIESLKGVKGSEKLVYASLPVRGYDILTAFPVHAVSLRQDKGEQEKDVSVAVLGLLGKMTGAAAVTSSTVETSDKESAVSVNVRLKALGVLEILVTDPERKGFVVRVEGEEVSGEAVRWTGEGWRTVLEVDVEAFWKAMETKDKEEREVEVEVRVW